MATLLAPGLTRVLADTYRGCAKYVNGSQCSVGLGCWCDPITYSCNSQEIQVKFKYTGFQACAKGQMDCHELYTFPAKCKTTRSCHIAGGGESCSVNPNNCEPFGLPTEGGDDITNYEMRDLCTVSDPGDPV